MVLCWPRWAHHQAQQTPRYFNNPVATGPDADVAMDGPSLQARQLLCRMYVQQNLRHLQRSMRTADLELGVMKMDAFLTKEFRRLRGDFALSAATDPHLATLMSLPLLKGGSGCPAVHLGLQERTLATCPMALCTQCDSYQPWNHLSTGGDNVEFLTCRHEEFRTPTVKFIRGCPGTPGCPISITKENVATTLCLRSNRDRPSSTRDSSSSQATLVVRQLL